MLGQTRITSSVNQYLVGQQMSKISSERYFICLSRCFFRFLDQQTVLKSIGKDPIENVVSSNILLLPANIFQLSEKANKKIPSKIIPTWAKLSVFCHILKWFLIPFVEIRTWTLLTKLKFLLILQTHCPVNID